MATKITPGKPLPKGQTSMYEKNRPGKKKVTAPAVQVTAPAVQLGVSARNPFFGAVQQPLPQSKMPIDPKQAFFNAVPTSLPQSQQIPLTPSQAFFGAANSLPQSFDTQQSRAPSVPNLPVNTEGQAYSSGSSPAWQQQPQRDLSVPDQIFLDSVSRTSPRAATFIENSFDAIKERFKEETFATLGISIDGYQPPAGTQFTAPMAIPGAGEIEKLFAKQLALNSVSKNSIKNAANMEKIGKKIVSPGGIEEVASNTAEAAGNLKKGATAAGEVVDNSKNMKEILKQITKDAKAYAAPLTVIGAVFGFYYGKKKSVSAGRTAIDDDATAFSKSFVQDGKTLTEAGYPELANEIYQCAEDVKTALESGDFDNIFDGKEKGLKAMNECRDRLYNGLTQVEKDKTEKAKQDAIDKAAADAAALEEQRLYNEQQKEEQRLYNEQQKEEQRLYNEAQRDEQRRYNEQQIAAQAEAEAIAEATALEGAEGSTLNFGLLSTGGAVQFVDQDKAAQVYFKKPYEELTPEQRALLNLLKR
jgi:hypothetical protein